MSTSTVLLTALAALFSAVGGLTAAASKLFGIVAPLWRRRSLPVAVLTEEGAERAAADFVQTLRGSGYKTVVRTLSPLAVPASTRAVVIWRPSPATVETTVETVQACAPESTILVLSSDRLPLRPGDALLLSNSALRMRSDLAALAEGSHD